MKAHFILFALIIAVTGIGCKQNRYAKQANTTLTEKKVIAGSLMGDVMLEEGGRPTIFLCR